MESGYPMDTKDAVPMDAQETPASSEKPASSPKTDAKKSEAKDSGKRKAAAKAAERKAKEQADDKVAKEAERNAQEQAEEAAKETAERKAKEEEAAEAARLLAEEQKQKEEARLQEQARLHEEEQKQKEETRLKEQARLLAEEEKQKEEARLKERARLLAEEEKQKEEARLKEEAEKKAKAQQEAEAEKENQEQNNATTDHTQGTFYDRSVLLNGGKFCQLSVNETSPRASDVMGTLANFWNGQVEATKAIAYKGSEGIGLSVDWDTGRVEKILEGGASEFHGLVAGSKFLTLDGAAYTPKLLNMKIAREKDFTAVFNVPSESSVTKRAQKIGFISATFKPGSVGIEFKAEGPRGRIDSVVDGGQAETQGLTAGMIFKSIDGEPFTKSLWEKRRQGDSDFDVTLIYGDALAQNDAKRNAIHLVSRCSRCGTFPEEKAWTAATSWQLERWWPDGRIGNYVACFGLEAQSSDAWTKSLQDISLRLGVAIKGHIKKGGQNWYMLDCCLSKGNAELTTWPAPRTLSQMLRLYERVREALDNRYGPLFDEVPFADPSGPAGTTAKLQKWMANLAALLNEDILSPSYFSLIMFFLCAPVASEEDFYNQGTA